MTGAVDALHAGDHQANIGKRVILPSSHPGSPRNMHQNYLDAMTVVQVYGKPDLFITMTCNPRWKEITDNLRFTESAADRPDLTARVFKMKLDAVLKDICVNGIFGKVIAKINVIEFQKRGLPHAHILLILEQNYKFRSTDDYDNAVCAELPNPITQPRLYEIVTTCMIHGPCGDALHKKPCEKSSQSKNGKCRFNYPKQKQETTTDSNNSFPNYKRRDNRTHVRGVGAFAEEIDNCWVSPYSPWLTSKYNCHINVEICPSISAVKYLFKYVYKGHDMTMFTLQRVNQNNNNIPEEIDEIKQYSSARYVTANEAIWHLFGFNMSDQTPCVIR